MPPLPGASLADWSSAWRVGKFSDSKTLVSYALQWPDGLKMFPAVNFGGSAVGGMGWPGLKKPTGSHGSLDMSSAGWGATVRAARAGPGTRRAAARAATAAILKLMYGRTPLSAPTCGHSPPRTGGVQRCRTRQDR